jgi:hypothetical protein
VNRIKIHGIVFLIAVAFGAGAYVVVKAMIYVNRAYFGGW